MYVSMWTLKLLLLPHENQLGTLNSLPMVYVPYDAIVDAHLIKFHTYLIETPPTINIITTPVTNFDTLNLFRVIWYRLILCHVSV